MNGFAKFLKWLAGLFGVMLMLAGFLVFFVGLVANNMMANVDDFDRITAASVSKFIGENKPEIREFVKGYIVEQVGPGFNDITKENFILLCSQPSVMNVDGTGAIDFQNILGTSVCPGIEQKSIDEIRNEVIDEMITQNIEEILAQVNRNAEVKASLEQAKAVFEGGKMIIFGGAVFVWLLGIFFVFVSASFKWKKLVYIVTVQTALNLIAVGLVFLYVSSITPEGIVRLIGLLQPRMPMLAATNAPPLIIKFGATIVIDWLHIAMSPLVPVAFIASVPFTGVAVWFLIKRIKEKKAAKASGGKVEVV